MARYFSPSSRQTIYANFKSTGYLFAITTPVLDIQRRRYEDEEQENTRDRYSLASLLEANPQKYQGTSESHRNEYGVNLSRNEPSVSGSDMGNEDSNEDIPQGVNGDSNIEYGDALCDIFRMGDVSKLTEYPNKHQKEFRGINNAPVSSV
ncbi:hypothetical protein Tco_1442869 [Tanacetum coccineum]